MMDLENRYVDFFYEKYQGRVAIGVGYDQDLSEIYPFVFSDTGGASLGGIALSPLSQDAGPVVYIFHFSSFNTHQGDGNIMLGELCRKADDYIITLSLSPIALANGNPDLMSSRQLEIWYSKFGFEGDICFRREPLGQDHR
ncbi:MAG: hypothetical protein KKD44_24610 [Proteobacteria bacterium]|nr:hypothetical protein [Pseudomonadota bacterium]